MRRVEYLDLELSNHNYRLNIDKNKFRCNFKGTFTHQLHSEHNSQLNSIIDNQINFAENIKISNLFLSSMDHLRNTRSIIKNQDKKLDYIQDQCSSILQKRIESNLENFPTKLEIETLISTINTSNSKQIELEFKQLIEKIHSQINQIAKQVEQIKQIQDNLKKN